KKWACPICRLGTLPSAFTSTITSVGRGCGIVIRSSFIGSPYSCRRAAIIVGMAFIRANALEATDDRQHGDKSQECKGCRRTGHWRGTTRRHIVPPSLALEI